MQHEKHQAGTRDVSSAVIHAPSGSDAIAFTPSDYQDGRLTRSGMEKRIKAGQSVLFKGQTISTLAAIPAESELATTETEVASALEKNDRLIADLQAQNAKLKGQQKPDAKK